MTGLFRFFNENIAPFLPYKNFCPQFGNFFRFLVVYTYKAPERSGL